MSEEIPMDLTWGNQNFDRSSDTITIFRVSPDESKKVASKYFDEVVKTINYPAHSQGSQLHGTFRHGKYKAEEGEYLLVRNVGTFMGTNVRYGAVILRVRAKGSMIQIDARVRHNEKSIHKDTFPALTLRGDVVSKDEAKDLGILERFTKEQRWHIFEEDAVSKAFAIKRIEMSDQTRSPTLQKFRTKTGTKSIAVPAKAARNIRVRKAK